MTNRDYLNQLNEPYRTQAFENIEKCRTQGDEPIKKWVNRKSLSFKDSLFSAFTWKLSPQKHEYWSNIANNPQNYIENENSN